MLVPRITSAIVARKLAVHLYWMWRQGWDYGQFEKLGSPQESPEIAMHHLTPIAHQMMKTPIAAGDETTGCPTFEWKSDLLAR